MSPRYGHVLIATDFSEPAQAAVRYGAALARHFAARVTLLHVFDAAIYARTIAPLSRAELEDSMAAAAREDLERIAGLHLADLEGVDCVTRCDASAPHGIVEHAREFGADLVVVGTHGRSGILRLLAGSVAEKVVRHAVCDVLAVPMSSPPWPPRRMLVGTDFSDASRPALLAAGEVGDALAAEVTVAHVYDDSRPPAEPGGVFETLDSAVARTRVAVDAVTRQHVGERGTTEVLLGTSAARELCSRAREMGAGLIVVGTHGRSGVAHLLIGSDAERTVRYAPCALLVVRSASEHRAPLVDSAARPTVPAIPRAGSHPKM
jgi:nucleotide-binding universal stress UspA family protein